jgi:hypothetical protein
MEEEGIVMLLSPLVAEVGYASPMTKTSKIVFKLLIPIINGSRKEIGGISHAEM